MKNFFTIPQIIFVFFVAVVIANNSPYVSQIEEIIISIKLNRGDVLFFDRFSQYKAQYERLKTISKERVVTPVEESDLSQLATLFEEILRDTEYLKPYLNGILEVREKALLNSAKDYAPELFEKADNDLRKLANQFLLKIPSGVELKIDEVAILYRQAEFEALRNKLLSEVRILFEESKDLEAEKLAPQSYNKVSNLIREVEIILQEKNYEDYSLSLKATRLLQESRHLLHLVQLAQRVNHDQTAFEQYILELEKSVGKLGEILKVEPQFGNGIKDYLGKLEIFTEELKNENQSLKKNNEILVDSLNALSQEIRYLEKELGRKRNFTEKVDNISKLLSDYSIKVIENHNNIVLRLNGVEFPPGKIQIDEGTQIKLQKIGESLHYFPSSTINVRLGQSAGGNAQYSKALAEQRAKAVALIIQSAGFIKDDRIRSEGILIDNHLNPGHIIIDVIVEL